MGTIIAMLLNALVIIVLATKQLQRTPHTIHSVFGSNRFSDWRDRATFVRGSRN